MRGGPRLIALILRIGACLGLVSSLAVVPAAAQERSPAVIALASDCAVTTPADGRAKPHFTIAIRGTDFNPFTAVLVTFDAGIGGRPETFRADSDGFGRFALTITPTERPPGSYVVRADDLRRREATATFRRLTLKLDPPLGRAGYVVRAIGAGFDAGSDATIAWDRGITLKSGAVKVTAEGTFRAPVLLFHHDVNGPRAMIATAAGTAVCSTAKASFLVVPGTIQPGAFDVRR